MSRIGRALRILSANPRLFLRVLAGKIREKGPAPRGTVKRTVNGVVFNLDFDFDPGPATRFMYFGTYEPLVVEAMRLLLKPGDTFIDVGANIGYLSAVGAGFVKTSGQVHSFEPVPNLFERLLSFAQANPSYNITPHKCALGDGEGTAKINVFPPFNIGWCTMVPGFGADQKQPESITVPVTRLDRHIEEHKLRGITLIKIDVEGFEFPVLKGLKHYFDKTDELPAIICEIAPDAYPLLDLTPAQLSEYLAHYGYRAFSIIDRRTEIDITKLEGTSNAIFLPAAREPCGGAGTQPRRRRCTGSGKTPQPG